MPVAREAVLKHALRLVTRSPYAQCHAAQAYREFSDLQAGVVPSTLLRPSLARYQVSRP